MFVVCLTPVLLVAVDGGKNFYDRVDLLYCVCACAFARARMHALACMRVFFVCISCLRARLNLICRTINRSNTNMIDKVGVFI